VWAPSSDATPFAGELASLTKGDIVGEEALVLSGKAKRVLTAKAESVPATVLRLEHDDIRRAIGSLDELQIAWRMEIVKNVPLLAPLSGYDQKKIVDVRPPRPVKSVFYLRVGRHTPRWCDGRGDAEGVV
jgi:hypothetical protein